MLPHRATTVPVPRRRIATHPALAGTSIAIRAMRTALPSLAPLDLNLALVGETGTGRRVVAEWLHHRSRYADRPFVALTFADATTRDAHERLFGPDGAVAVVRRAGGGTIYLEAVDHLAAEVQGRLVATLATEPRAGFRALAGSTQPLREHVAFGRFSRALFDRLAIVQLTLTPLRDRREDIEVVAAAWLQRWCEAHGRELRPLDAESLAVLREQHWSGNVHQLRLVLEEACVTAGRHPIRADHLRTALVRWPGPPIATDVLPLRRLRADYIMAALEGCGGNQSLAARRLGIGRNTLRRWLREGEIGDDQAA